MPRSLLFLFLASALISLGSAEWFAFRTDFRTNECTLSAANLDSATVWPNGTCVGAGVSSLVTCDGSKVYFWDGCINPQTTVASVPLGCDTTSKWSYHCVEANSVDDLIKRELQLSETYSGLITQTHRSSTDPNCANPVMFRWDSPTGSFAFCSASLQTWTINGPKAEISSCSDTECRQCTYDGYNYIDLGVCDSGAGQLKRALTVPGPVPPQDPPADAPADAPVDVPADAPVAAPVAAPVDAPVNAPIEPPIEAPVSAPVAAPVGAPAATVAAPVATPSSAVHVFVSISFAVAFAAISLLL